MLFLAEYIFQGTRTFQRQKRPLERKTLCQMAPYTENPPASSEGCKTGGDRLMAEDREMARKSSLNGYLIACHKRVSGCRDNSIWHEMV